VGKTSIIKVIFQKLSPQQTILLEPTQRMEIFDINLSPLIQFKILDFSGSFEFKDINPPEQSYLENCRCMIFVFDVQVLRDLYLIG
jgi:Ras-related GTP-binding protein C/D